jgi:hypothetical protein
MHARWAPGRTGVGVAALAMTLALAAGCSSNPNPASSNPPRSTTTTHHGPTSTPPTSSSTSSTSSDLCQPSQLQFSVGQSSGAAGTIEVSINLLNISSASCQLDGYPGMQLLNAAGSAIATMVIFGGGPQFPVAAANAPPTLVILAPQQTAAFSLSYNEIPSGTETTCPTSAKAEVTPPNDTAFAVVDLMADPCSGGTIHVSPIYAGGAN